MGITTTLQAIIMGITTTLQAIIMGMKAIILHTTIGGSITITTGLQDITQDIPIGIIGITIGIITLT